MLTKGTIMINDFQNKSPWQLRQQPRGVCVYAIVYIDMNKLEPHDDRDSKEFGYSILLPSANPPKLILVTVVVWLQLPPLVSPRSR